MKDDYFLLLKENRITNILGFLDDLSYTKKYKIIEKLLEKYSIDIINNCLYYYKHSYIDMKKVNYIYIDKVLVGICNRLVKEK